MSAGECVCVRVCVHILYLHGLFLAIFIFPLVDSKTLCVCFCAHSAASKSNTRRQTCRVKSFVQVKVESNKDWDDKFNVISTDTPAKTGFIACFSGRNLRSASVWFTLTDHLRALKCMQWWFFVWKSQKQPLSVVYVRHDWIVQQRVCRGSSLCRRFFFIFIIFSIPTLWN